MAVPSTLVVRGAKVPHGKRSSVYGSRYSTKSISLLRSAKAPICYGLQHGGAPPGCQTLVQVAESVTVESSMTDLLLTTPAAAERYDELLAVHGQLHVPLSCTRLRATCYSSLTAARIEAAVRRARSWGVCCMSVQRTARGHCTPMFLWCTSLTRACSTCAQNPDYDR